MHMFQICFPACGTRWRWQSCVHPKTSSSAPKFSHWNNIWHLLCQLKCKRHLSGLNVTIIVIDTSNNHLTAHGIGRVNVPSPHGPTRPGPARLLVVKDLLLSRQSDSEHPVTSPWTRAGDMKQNIIKRIPLSVRVQHKAKPQRKHFKSVWNCGKEPAGSST